MKPHTLDIRVRYCEVDRMGIVHHAYYLVYFEMGRTEFLRSLGMNYKDLEEKGFYLVLTKINCQYKASARYDDIITIETTLQRITRARIDHSYKIWRKFDGRLLVTGESTLACVDKDGEIKEMPSQLLSLHEGKI